MQSAPSAAGEPRGSLGPLDRPVRLLSRVFRIDAAYFIRASGWLGVALGAYQLVRFVETIGFAHFASPDLFGQFLFILALIQAASIFSLPGMDEAIIQSVTQGHESSLRAGTRIRFAASWLGSIVLVGAALYLREVRREEFWWFVLILAGLLPLLTAYSTHVPFLLGRSEYRRAAIRSLVLSGSYVVVTLGVLALTRKLIPVVLASVLVGLVGHQVYWRLTARNLPSDPTDPDLRRKGIHFTALSGLDYVAPHIDKLLVTFFLGFEQFAVYFVSVVFATQIAGLPLVAKPLLLVRFARPGGRHHERLPRDVLRLLVATAPIVAVGILAAPWFVPVFFTAKYADAVEFTQVAFSYVLFAVPVAVLQAFFQARARNRALYAQRLMAQGANILLLVTLVPRFGVLGAIVGKVGAAAFALVYLTILVWMDARNAKGPGANPAA